jgi:integrase
MVNALTPDTTIWDTDLRGFCARRQRSPAITYQLKMRVGGKIRWFTIGRHGQATPEGTTWTPETARRQAIKIMGNPSIAEKPADTAKPVRPLFSHVADEFLKLHGAKLKPRTLEEQNRIVRLYLKPAFGHQEIVEITRRDVETAHAGWKTKPRAANHALAVLSTMMNWAEEHRFRVQDTNPCRRIVHYPQHNRERFLQPDELARLGEALDQADRAGLATPPAIAAIRLLIYTGARLSEILTLKWSYVDFARRALLLPDSKTGQKTIPLNDAAIAELRGIPRLASNPFVIVGHIHGTHMVNLQKPWRRIRALAGLDDVRIHDLRHTFASIAVAAGGSLPIIGRALGHSQPSTTQRYAHLTDDPVRQLSQDTGQRLAAALHAKRSN